MITKFKIFKNKKLDINLILNDYLETALWTEEENEDLEGLTIYDVTEESKNNAKNEITWFINAIGDDIDIVENIGHDLWLTRNGHGAGFWDRDYPDDLTKLLVDISNVLNTANLYVNDYNKIEIKSNDKYKNFDIEQYKKDIEFKKDLRKYNV